MNNPSDADWQAELDRRRRLTMAHTKIDTGRILVPNEGAGWTDESPWRPAQPHEMVRALADIVEAMQVRIGELEAWRKRVQGD